MSVRIAAPPPAGGSDGRSTQTGEGGAGRLSGPKTGGPAPSRSSFPIFFLIPRWVFGVLGKLRFVIITSLRSFLFLTSLRSSFILNLPYDFLNLFLYTPVLPTHSPFLPSLPRIPLILPLPLTYSLLSSRVHFLFIHKFTLLVTSLLTSFAVFRVREVRACLFSFRKHASAVIAVLFCVGNYRSYPTPGKVSWLY